eukprot:CAMPEP_0116969870 /NCGR_PEP_ID=MMETSP0467-20121206/52209_1 /TAXON_ID=283647 /ORGANISM="Mesodinium pulex, Strain SPMC105" /LENGTH=81 /DNA_ID=CAMNT_0004660663 /DNA_START=589 /DNA_END=834 /DNA_ORIENTATION=-
MENQELKETVSDQQTAIINMKKCQNVYLHEIECLKQKLAQLELESHKNASENNDNDNDNSQLTSNNSRHYNYSFKDNMHTE